jgi:hypothetical protein
MKELYLVSIFVVEFNHSAEEPVALFEKEEDADNFVKEKNTLLEKFKLYSKGDNSLVYFADEKNYQDESQEPSEEINVARYIDKVSSLLGVTFSNFLQLSFTNFCGFLFVKNKNPVKIYG